MSNPQFSNVAMLIVPVTASVSTVASAKISQVGPFRGLFLRSTASFTLNGIDGNDVLFDAVPPGFFWVQGNFLSVIATATATLIYALK